MAVVKKSHVILTTHFKEAKQLIVSSGKERMVRSTKHVRNKYLSVLSGTRHGRTYRVPGTRNAYYIASAPGEPPASPTGTTLKANVKDLVEVKKKEIDGFVGIREKGDIGKVAVSLEFGRRGMAPRPSLGPTFEFTKGVVKAILSGRWF